MWIQLPLRASDSDCVCVEKMDSTYERLALAHMAHMVHVLHHAKARETAITPLPIPMRWSGMSDNWDEDIPSEGMKAKMKRKCHVSFLFFFSFFLLGRGDSLDYQSVLYFIFRIGPGVGVDHESRVGVGAGTAPPRLRSPDCCKRNC